MADERGPRWNLKGVIPDGATVTDAELTVGQAGRPRWQLSRAGSRWLVIGPNNVDGFSVDNERAGKLACHYFNDLEDRLARAEAQAALADEAAANLRRFHVTFGITWEDAWLARYDALSATLTAKREV